jgi:serpin B
MALASLRNQEESMKIANFGGSSVAFALTLGVVGCASDGPSRPSRPDPSDFGVGEVKSSLARLPADASPQAISALVTDDTAFALSLYDALMPGENFVFSPHSISTALAMLYPGTAGTTKSQMQTALHFTQPDAELEDAFNTLDQALASRGTNTTGSSNPFRLKVANALWGQQGMSFLPSYLDVLAQSFGAGINTVDFAGDPERARDGINAEVADQTQQKISELLPADAIDERTRFVLTNAVYFDAQWATAFQPEATAAAAFSELDGSSVDVPFMHATLTTSYAEGDGWQAVLLPYEGKEISLLVILPADGGFADFSSGLDADGLASIEAQFELAEVELSLPRFEFKAGLSLNESLMALGMTDAFTPNADLSGVDGARDLFVGDVVHQAFIHVDEHGTEAAAATAVTGRDTLGSPTYESRVFDASRPFLFAIRDDATHALLFWGQVTNPLG